MKFLSNRLGLWAGLAVVMIVIAAIAQTVDIRSKSIQIANADNNTMLRLMNTSSNQTNPFLEIWAGPSGPVLLSIPATGIIPAANCSIQSGTNKVVNLSSNITFPTPFIGIPRVVAVDGDGVTDIGVTNITTTNFTLISSAANTVVNWIAVAPQ